MRPVTIIMAFLSAAFPLTIQGGEEEVPLTWEECVGQAREFNPDLKSAEADVEQAAANVGKSRSDLFPQVSGSFSARHSKSSEEDRSESYSYSLTARQLLFDGLQTWYDMASQDQSFIASLYDYDTTSASIRLSLREAFVELLKSQELLGITRGIAERRRQQLDMVQLRYEAGREHKGSLMTARANLSEAEFDVRQAGRDIALARRQLINEIGRPAFIAVKAEGSLEVRSGLPESPDMDALTRTHPSVLAQTAQKEIAQYGVKSAWSSFFPEISGTGSVGRSASEWPPHDEDWSVGVSVSVPVFEGGDRLKQLDYEKASLRAAEEELRSEINDVLYDLESKWKRFQDALEEVEIQRQFLAADEERARISESQYSNGLLSFDNWIIIEDNLVRSKKSYLESKADALRAEAEWEESRGVTLGFSGNSNPILKEKR